MASLVTLAMAVKQASPTPSGLRGSGICSELVLGDSPAPHASTGVSYWNVDGDYVGLGGSRQLTFRPCCFGRLCSLGPVVPVDSGLSMWSLMWMLGLGVGASLEPRGFPHMEAAGCLRLGPQSWDSITSAAVSGLARLWDWLARFGGWGYLNSRAIK